MTGLPARASVRDVCRKSGPLLAIAAFVATVLLPFLAQRGALYWGDIYLYFYPLEDMVAGALRSGRLPLWNPYILCGQPLVGNPQSWVFYPSTVLLGALDVWSYLTANAAIHLGLAGLGGYLYMRRLTGDRIAAVLGAITFCGSGFMVARLQFPTVIQAAAYLPWMLLLTDRIIDRPRIGYATWFALVVGLSLLAAHTQTTYLSLLLVIAYAMVRLLHRHKASMRGRAATMELVGAVVVGAMLASIQLLPTLQLFTLSTRAGLSFAKANRFVFAPENLVTFLFPYYYGDPLQGSFWGRGNLWEPCVYIGLVPLGLALWAAWVGRRRPAVRFYVGAAVVALWLAMGKFGGLYWVAFNVVPGLRAFHDPARFTLILTFGLAALAAIGMRLLREAGLPNRWRAALVVASAANLAWFGGRFNPILDTSTLDTAYRPRALAVLPSNRGARVFSANREQVWDRYLNYSDYGPDSGRYVHELTDTLVPNTAMPFRIEEASGYEPVPVRAVTEVDGLVRSALERGSPKLTDLLRLFDAQTLLLPLGTCYRHADLERVRVPGVAAYIVREPMSRAWLVRSTIVAQGDARSLAALMADDFDPTREAVVCDRRARLDAPVGSGESAAAVVTHWSSAEEGAFAVDCGRTAGLLVVSATWYPGWRATVDGRVSPLFRANHAFIGVALGPGRHGVRLLYRPDVFLVASYVTMLAVSIICGGMTVGLLARRRRRSSRLAARGIGARLV